MHHSAGGTARLQNNTEHLPNPQPPLIISYECSSRISLTVVRDQVSSELV